MPSRLTQPGLCGLQVNKLDSNLVLFHSIIVLYSTSKQLYAGSFCSLIYYVYLNLNLFKNHFYVLYLLTDKGISIKFIAACYKAANIENIVKSYLLTQIQTYTCVPVHVCVPVHLHGDLSWRGMSVYVCVCTYIDLDKRFVYCSFGVFLHVCICVYIILNCQIFRVDCLFHYPQRESSGTLRTHKLHNKRKRATIILLVLLCFASLLLNGLPSQPASCSFFPLRQLWVS